MPALDYDFCAPLDWLTDSRNLSRPEKTLFFALRGANHDGHRFVPELLEKGVRYFVVEEEMPAKAEATFFRVPNVLRALQELVATHRSQFTIPVIGITGSNGKTIVKEWLFETLKEDFLIAKSPKSYNSQIGVPLSVRGLSPEHELGIFEAGISERNEMQHLEPLVRPTIGVFTNLGTAHDEGFSDRYEKAREKARLFRRCPLVVYPESYPEIREALREHPNAQPWRWLSSSEEKTLRFRYRQTDYTLRLPFQGHPLAENAVAVAITLLELGFTITEAASKIQALRDVPMRLSLKRGRRNSLLVDDTYNNDFAGLEVALNFLQNNAPQQSKTVILSDIPQSGREAAALYPQIVRLCQEKGIRRLIGVGEGFEKVSESAPFLHTFPDTADLLRHLETLPDWLENEAVLIKGARVFGFERVVRALEAKVHGTRLEINLSALRHNLNFYRQWLRPETRLLVMVKAFAYGSGNREVARLLEHQRVAYLGVAYTDEGVALRQDGIRLPIMVLNPTPETFPLLLRYRLEPELYNLPLLRAWQRFVRRQTGTPPPAHLKLDTGMRRLGFEAEQISELLAAFQEYPVPVASVFTHLAAADDPNEEDFTRGQLNTFSALSEEVVAILPQKPLRHALNSAGIMRFPEFQFDMVRLGIGLYGIEASGEYQNALRPISTLKTTVSQIKTLPPHTTIGYGRRGKATAAGRRTATVAIGYADGYPRHFSNGVGKMWIRGQLAPVIGSVCMDMTMVDISHIEGVREGDEVIVFGSHFPLTAAAAAIGTIPYELLTNIGGRVRRVFFEE